VDSGKAGDRRSIEAEVQRSKAGNPLGRSTSFRRQVCPDVVSSCMLTAMAQTPATDSSVDYLAPEFDPIAHLTHPQRMCWDRQERLLDGYSAAGTIKAGLLRSGVPRRTAEHWRTVDYLGFARRLERAHRAFCDEVEDKMWSLASKLQPGQNALTLIALANANMPEKFRGTAPVINIDARSVSAELAEIGRKLKASPPRAALSASDTGGAPPRRA
jgi:hypothetical protein